MRQRRASNWFSWLAIACLAAATDGSALAADKPRRPNVVIILADDLGYGDLACYGNTRFRTPHLDRMAAEGARLTNFNAPAPFCAPTRASLMTGRYPFRCGLTSNPAPDFGAQYTELGLPESEKTLAELLRGSGYATGMFGKWHLGHAKKSFYPVQRGFDEYLGILHSNDMRPVQLIEGEKIVEYPVVQATLTKRYTARAIDFIQRHKDQPFFLYFAHAMVHKPIAASEEYYRQSGAGLYGDAMAELDASVGQVCAKLQELKLADNTLVIFTSDNGPWFGGSSGGLRGMKGTSWEGGYRVPLIARWPGRIPAGHVSTQPAVMMDVFSTALAAAGVAAPTDRVIDGDDLMPLLTSDAASPHVVILGQQAARLATVRDARWKLHVLAANERREPRASEAPWVDPRAPDGVTLLAPFEQYRPSDYPGLSTGDPPAPMALFDLQTDPGEQHNVAAANPDVVQRLKAQFDAAQGAAKPTVAAKPVTDVHDPSNAVAQLDVHLDLAVTLFASEPMFVNPASIDVDERGRVWVCEAINYREFRNADVMGNHKEGDRILVLEDTDGDAKADKTTVFYQGHDVDSAHGVMVMPAPNGKGTKALVSALDSVMYLIDDDGDLRADRKELLFTGIDGVQHDHGIHACHFGPDGKLYFNYGNMGRHIKDKLGRPIVDKMGHEVNDSRQPYQEGMVFRCNPDGSEFETLAWNFRNNWELCVDSFGTIWQSDNDDDGNQGCRINYVMEFGNYGYKDERTGAAWKEPRTNWEAEIPRRHWHLDDPGVVPNVLQTGAGAPAGICKYEGGLLPTRFHGAIFHTDPGTNVCRAYATSADGAGYSATSVNILDGSRDKWFRPCDICVAPDGSLLVADWYDPGVGGHRMEDIGRGRIFRIAPKGEAGGRYRAPAVDVATPQSAMAAFKSPNMATRILAWNAIQRMGATAETELEAMRQSDNPAFRGRAVWMLGKLGLSKEKAAAVVREAAKDKDPDIRVVGVRLARQLAEQLSVAELRGALNFDDPSPAVQREMLLGLHDLKPYGLSGAERDAVVPGLWAQLARRYDGHDRWLLEALGIAAEDRWDLCLAALAHEAGKAWKTDRPGRDIVWRSRGVGTSELLAALITDPATPADETPRFFRALDFQPPGAAQRVLPELALGDHRNLPADRVSLIRAESLNRLKGFDAAHDARYRATLEKALDDCAGSEQFIRLVDTFSVADRYLDLLAMAQAQPESQLAVDALAVLYGKEQWRLFTQALKDKNVDTVERTLAAMTTAADPRGNGPLLALLDDEDRPLAVMRLTVKALGATMSGAQSLLDLTKQHKLPDQLQHVLAATLTAARWGPVRESAVLLWPPPPAKDSRPLPPLADLIAMKGDSERGRAAFTTTGTCSKCHRAGGAGKDVGPDLSEIGNKLARQAMFESILYPSAAVSHNYETTVVVTEDGLSHSGILVSETDAELKLKDENDIVRTIPVDQIEERSKSDVSMMPADIQKLLSAQELVDLVEYLTTLTKK